MCRKNSRGSNDIRCFGEDMRTKEWRLRLQGHQFHSTQDPLQRVTEGENSIKRFLSWRELNQDVYVTVWPRRAALHRPKKRGDSQGEDLASD